MNTEGHIQSAFLDNLAFSLMGRMHVILRRQNERVTDIEYMRIDPGYCRYILDLAAKLPNEDLKTICAKLEEIYFGSKGLFKQPAAVAPLLPPRASAPVPAVARHEVPEDALPSLDQNSLIDQTYIGRLR